MKLTKNESNKVMHFVNDLSSVRYAILRVDPIGHEEEGWQTVRIELIQPAYSNRLSVFIYLNCCFRDRRLSYIPQSEKDRVYVEECIQ